MTNNTKDKKLEQVEELQNKERNKYWKNINTKLLILAVITLITPLILFYIDWNYFAPDDYLFWLSITIYVESFFVYFIKKIIPRIKLWHIRTFLALMMIYQYQIGNGWDRIGLFVILLFLPILCGISYFGGYLITTIILTIQHLIKKEKIYDDEMKKICEWLWIGLLILIGLFIYYKISLL